MTSKLLTEHLTVVLCAICIAIVAGLFLGVIAYLFPKARKVILNLADLLQTISMSDSDIFSGTVSFSERIQRFLSALNKTGKTPACSTSAARSVRAVCC